MFLTLYIQRGGQRFIYRSKTGWWYANTDLGAETGVVRTRELKSSGLAWYYGTGGGGWVNNDTSIEFVPLGSPHAHCLACQQITIESSGRAQTIVADFLGVFERLKDVYVDGRPVYMNGNGKYIHKDGKATYGIRTKFTNDGVSVQSASGPLCPFLEKASSSERFGDGWRFWTDSVWEHDMTMNAKCTRY